MATGINRNGVVLWEGISVIDNVTPVALIAIGFTRKSTNRKTDAMIQTYLIRSDMDPVDAVMSRRDVGICGSCLHRKQPDTVSKTGKVKRGKRTCYVNLGKGVRGVYRCYARGGYRRVTLQEAAKMLAGRVVRMGTYGDPTAAPFHVWDAFMPRTAGHTGYTHQWRAPKFRPFAKYVQASCDVPEDVADAARRGFAGSFLVMPVGIDAPEHVAELCPSLVGVSCLDCRKCNGTAAVWIPAHGPAAKQYQPTARKGLPVLA